MDAAPMLGRHAEAVAALKRAVLQSPGVTEPAARLAAFGGEDLPAPFGDYAAKVQEASERITDRDVQALLQGGCTQDAVFELTVAAALGAAMRRLEAGLRPLRERG